MTSVVTFPGLGLEFELNRVAFNLFGKDIYWYGIIIACGFLLAVSYGMWKAPKYHMDRDQIIDMLLFAVPLCIIGARAYYVIFEPSICFDSEGRFSFYRMIAIWDGGLAIYGAVLVAIVVVLIFCKVRKACFWDYADLGILGVMIGQMVGRWGNFVNVEAYGGLTDAPWRMCSETIANWLWGQRQITTMEQYQAIIDGTLGVHPTFFYESLWNFIGFLLLALLARKRRVKGQTFAGYLIWYGLGRAVIEGLRTDSLYFFGTGIRSSQMLGLISAVIGVIMLIVRFQQAKTDPMVLPEELRPAPAVEAVAAEAGDAAGETIVEEVEGEAGDSAVDENDAAVVEEDTAAVEPQEAGSAAEAVEEEAPVPEERDGDQN